jgi:hypothetical protein
MGIRHQPERGAVETHVVDGLVLMRAFFKITDAADRRKVIELAASLVRVAPAGLQGHPTPS